MSDSVFDRVLRSPKNMTGKGINCLPVCSFYLFLTSLVCFLSFLFPWDFVMKNIFVVSSHTDRKRWMMPSDVRWIVSWFSQKNVRTSALCISFIKGTVSWCVWQKDSILRLAFTWQVRELVQQMTGLTFG